MSFRNGFYAGLVVAAIWGVYLARLWQPQRQVELHSIHLLEQIEKRNWKTVAEFLDDNYQDRWGDDRVVLVERLREVFRAMPGARIESNAAAAQTEGDRGFWTAKIALKGTGEFASFIEGRVNSLDTPFEFEWHRGPTWPWRWKLVSVRNPALEIPAEAR